MAHFLVTGGAGFIGSHLVEALVRRGDQVRVLDNFSTGSMDNLSAVKEQISVIPADIRDPAVAREAADGVDVVLHLAALASVPLSIERPQDTHDHCASGTLSMLTAAQAVGVRRFVYSSSSSIYGNRDDQQQTETDLPAPESPYAAAKLAGEYYCSCFDRSMGLETVVLRYFNVFGPRQSLEGPYAAVIPAFITAALRGQPAVIYGDGSQTRDFTFVESVVSANLLAAETAAAAGQFFNVAHGTSTSVEQLHQLIQELTATSTPADYQQARAGDVLHSKANIERAVEQLNFQPDADLRAGLAKTIDYYRN